MTIPAGADLPQLRHVHSDAKRYMVWTLWIAGWPASAIAAVVGMSTKATLGIAQRSPFPPRSSMTDDARRHALAELAAVRCDAAGRPIDGGRLPAAAFELRPLREVQRR